MTSCSDSGLVFVRVVTEFTTESGEMFEILLGDTAFYYRFKESGEMFEIRHSSVFPKLENGLDRGAPCAKTKH